MSFRERLTARADAVRAALLARIGALGGDPVVAGMAHACAGGKGLRGFLVLEGAALHGVDAATALPAAEAIEALHAYSLIHDDLPCMDDDDLRRGRPTVHVTWDEATAVLAGDALQSLAFAALAGMTVPAERRVALVAGLARGGGAMVLGQARDIAAEGQALDLDAIARLQALKTGALIDWAATAGPVMAGADPGPLAGYARALGLAFQIADDILDVEGDARRAGKRLQKDGAAGKATFVSHLGVEGARARAQALADGAVAALAPYGPAADPLRDAARFVIARDA